MDIWSYLFVFILNALLWFGKILKGNFISRIAISSLIFALAIIELLIIRFCVEIIRSNEFPFIVNSILSTAIVILFLIYALRKRWNRWIILLIASLTFLNEFVVVAQLLDFFKDGSLITVIKKNLIVLIKHVDPIFLSSVATFFTTFLILLTLYEYRAQRKSSYLPKLILESSSNLNLWFKKITETEGVFLPIHWTKDIHDASELDLSSPADSLGDGLKYSLNCHNLGNGNAIFVNFYWNFNLKKMIGAINKDKKTYGFTVKKVVNNISITRPDDITEHWPLITNIAVEQISKGDFIKIELPTSYLILSSILTDKYIHENLFEKSQKKFVFSLFDGIKEILSDVDILFPLELKIVFNSTLLTLLLYISLNIFIALSVPKLHL